MTRIVSFSESEFGLGTLHCAMLAAFSDYIVPLQPDADTFKAALRSRGFDPEGPSSPSMMVKSSGFGAWRPGTTNVI